MTIKAKFPGTCAKCGQRITPGQLIDWAKGQRAVHADCGAAGTPEQASPPPAVSYPPTPEQQVALDLFATGQSLAIEAGAGTGKTSTLLMLANSAPNRNGQYVAFNRAIVREAESKMPGSVKCNTAHSLAARWWRQAPNSHGRLDSSRRLKSIEVANILGLDGLQLGDKHVSRSYLAGVVMAGIRRFCQSADLTPDRQHVPFIEGLDPMVDGNRTYTNNNEVRVYLRPFLVKAWADLMSRHGQLRFDFDHMLKAWHLSNPTIESDYILFDEAQDANPVMVAVISAQQAHAQLVWVGDSQQQIYTFTGAVNALAKVPAESRAYLTQSFRFGPAIAQVANDVLDRLDAELRLVGTESITSEVGTVDEPDAILTRTNAVAVSTVLREQAAGRQPALVGGGVEVVKFAKAARELMDHGSTEHVDLACFDSWAEVVAYVDEDEQGGELRLLVKLVTDFGVQTILDALDRVIDEADADVIVSTAHKAKGREWNSVQLASDFPEAPGEEELRLLYVAATRARRHLDVDAVTLFNGGPSEGSPDPEEDR